jgi:hypothetical protein
MSKIKEKILRDQELQMEYNFMFMDKMYDVLRPELRLSEKDIEIMEKSYANNSNPTVKKPNEIVSLNNTNTAKENILTNIKKDIA